MWYSTRPNLPIPILSPDQQRIIYNQRLVKFDEYIYKLVVEEYYLFV